MFHSPNRLMNATAQKCDDWNVIQFPQNGQFLVKILRVVTAGRFKRSQSWLVVDRPCATVDDAISTASFFVFSVNAGFRLKAIWL